MRRALQYSAITGPPARGALRGADACRAAGTCTRARSRPSSGSPATRRSPRASWSRATSRSPPTSGQPLHLLHLSARESVERCGARRRPACARRGEVTPHHLCLTDEAVRSLDPNLKMNPPLRDGGATAGADRGAARRDDRGDRDRPRAARARGEGRPVRGGAVRRHRPRDGVRGALHPPRRAGLVPLETLLERMSAGPARIFGLDPPRIAVGAPANLVLLDPEGDLARARGRLPLALGELVAARRAAPGQGRC